MKFKYVVSLKLIIYVQLIALQLLIRSTDLPARDITHTHTHDMLLHHRNI